MKFDIDDLTKICRESPNLVTNSAKVSGTLHEDAVCWRHKSINRSVRVNWCQAVRIAEEV